MPPITKFFFSFQRNGVAGMKPVPPREKPAATRPSASSGVRPSARKFGTV